MSYKDNSGSDVQIGWEIIVIPDKDEDKSS